MRNKTLSPRVVIIAFCYLFPLIMLRAVNWLAADKYYVWPDIHDVSSGLLPTLQVAASALTVGAIVAPYFLTGQFMQMAERRGSQQHDAELQLLFVGLAFADAPTLYGLVLLLLGNSMQQFYYYVAASCLGMLAWSIYMLVRKRRSSGRKQ